MINENAEDLFAAWALRAEAGDALDFDAFVAEHAEHAGALRKVHDDWKLFAPLLGRVVPGVLGVDVKPLSGSTDEPIDLPSKELIDRLGIHTPNEGRYRFRAVIGRGGGGVVLKVWDEKLKRSLAMKVVLGQSEDRPTGDTPRVDGRTLSRFVDEARIASQLNHPSIVPVHELGADETGRAFFTMKLVKGENLSVIFQHVKTGYDGWNQTRALNVLLKVCEAMSFAHEKGVIHRDLKPANIMVGRYGEVHVMDWGLARVMGEKNPRDLRVQRPANASQVDSIRAGDRAGTPNSPLHTMDGTVIGTPSYMSPEQARNDGEVGSRTDVYAIGAMLYELLAGHPPYVPLGANVSDWAIYQMVLDGPPKSIEAFVPRPPVELAAICERAMHRDASHRYGMTPALANDLRAFLEQRVVLAYEAGTWAETKKWMRRNRTVAMAVACATLAAIAGAVAFDWKAEQALLQSQIASRREREAAAAHIDSMQHNRESRRNLYIACISGADTAVRYHEVRAAHDSLLASPAELRSWEWHYLSALADPSLWTAIGHFPSYSSDGALVVTVSGPDACVWDSATGARVSTLVGHRDKVSAAEFVPNSSRIATTSLDGTIRIWDAKTGAEMVSLVQGSPPTSLSLNTNGSVLAAMSVDRIVRVWDLANRRMVASIEGVGPRHAWQLSRDGRELVAALGGQVTVWTLEESLEPQRFELADNWSGRFSSDGMKYVALDKEGLLRIWDTSRHTSTIAQGHAESGSYLIDISPGGAFLAVCGWLGQSARILSTNDGTLVATIAENEPLGVEFLNRLWNGLEVECATFGGRSDTVFAIASGRTVRVWSLPRGIPSAVIQLSEKVSRIEVSPDEQTVVTATRDDVVQCWDVRDEAVRALDNTFDVDSVVCSRDGTRVVCVGATSAYLWDPVLGMKLGSIGTPSDGLQGACLSPDGMRLALFMETGGQVLDSTTGRLLVRLQGQSLRGSGGEFSSDGLRVVAAQGGVGRMWDAETGVELLRIDDGSQSIDSAVFDPGGRCIVTGSPNGVSLWDSSTGEPQRHWCSEPGVAQVSFSPDGTRLAVALTSGVATIMDRAMLVPLLHLVGHSERVSDIAWSGDGTRVITGSDDGSVRLWDSCDGRQVLRLDGAGKAVTSVASSSDGSVLFVASGEAMVRVYDSMPYFIRREQRRTIVGASVEAERQIALLDTPPRDWTTLADLVRSSATMTRSVQRVALNIVTQRSCGRGW